MQRPEVKPAAGLGEHELAEYYDSRYAGDYMAEHPDLEIRRVEQVLGETGGVVRGVLDFGRGRGSWIPTLERAFPEARITGVDISDAALAHARRSFPSHRFMRFDGERTPLPAGGVDLVFSYHVLEHVLNLEATVAEIARVLPAGGQACVIFPCANRGSLEERLVQMGDGGVDPVNGRFFFEDPGHLRRLTSEQAVELFRRAGLELVRDWYANQLWGAIDFLARVGTGLSGELLAPDRARSSSDRAKLGALRLALLALTPIMQAHYLSRPWDRWRAAHGVERLLWTGALMAKALALPIGSAVEGLARREWARGRNLPNGSSQYLLFVKR
jgi:SAM-dependent methyltransferase